jgi:hypothetical protein
MMVPTERITKERLASWEEKFRIQHATPILLVGIGHDWNSGQGVACVVDETDPALKAMLATYLRAVLKEFES